MDVVIRAATAADEPFLRLLLYEAAAWRVREPRELVLARPENAKYIDGWPPPGDRGVVADARRFPADDRGYGFVAEDVPELTIAVVAEARGRGIGERLLRAL